MNKLELNNVESFFKQKVDECADIHGNIGVEDAVNLMTDFFNHNLITHVSEHYPDNDFLYFEYGIHSRRDSKDEKFTIAFSRNFYHEEPTQELGDPYQLLLMLYYDKNHFEKVEAYGRSMNDFDDANAWKEHFKRTDCFKTARDIKSKSFDVLLHKEEFS